MRVYSLKRLACVTDVADRVIPCRLYIDSRGGVMHGKHEPDIHFRIIDVVGVKERTLSEIFGAQK